LVIGTHVIARKLASNDHCGLNFGDFTGSLNGSKGSAVACPRLLMCGYCNWLVTVAPHYGAVHQSFSLVGALSGAPTLSRLGPEWGSWRNIPQHGEALS
jgi:hypothetical protein